MIIDSHTHFAPAQCIDVVSPSGARLGPVVRQGGEAVSVIESPRGRPMGSPAEPWVDLDRRVEEMASLGVDVQVLVPNVTEFPGRSILGAGLTDSDLRWYARLQNDAMASIVAGTPDSFIGLGVVPLYDAPAAKSEAERVVEAGLSGIALPTAFDQMELDDDRLDGFYDVVAGSGIPIFVHPTVPPDSGSTARFFFKHAIGIPTATAVAAGTLILGGVLDRHPSLSVVLAHAGGTFLWLLGRFAHAYDARPSERPQIRWSPGEYAEMMYYDTITHSDANLACLIRFVGADRLLFGTDYPASMADYALPERLESERVPQEDRARILGLNAAEVFPRR